ncbi:glycosyltransferase [Flavobacterium sediminilitoris]|uniref:Glycosyltransferase n=1 Tax=Flavobacterium sediminilitoris TaxID=2024526 RepID=A0ABY4HKB8_9FLAO|nr:MULTISPECIES: glycosyltransferase [Flavobacterium]UOX32762.1 glycosyltransferase [Flavobacterium sediminilitoris]
MLSILIPTYNYNTFPLVEELKKQADLLFINYEILVQDDGSHLFSIENSKINNLDNCSFDINKKNLGRTTNRNILAKKAKYDLLLFLDADVIPNKSNFISLYLEQAFAKEQVIFGGYIYSDKKPDSSIILRYKYGKEREEKKASIRNLKPYSNVLSGNMLINKQVFFECNFNSEENLYGMDIYFGYQLFIKKIPIIHIDNPIIHQGLEINIVFFKKALESVESRKTHLVNKNGIEEINPLLKHYKKIDNLKLTKIVSILFILFKKQLEKKIVNINPNLFYFDLYRLGYICYLKSK